MSFLPLPPPSPPALCVCLPLISLFLPPLFSIFLPSHEPSMGVAGKKKERAVSYGRHCKEDLVSLPSCRRYTCFFMFPKRQKSFKVCNLLVESWFFSHILLSLLLRKGVLDRTIARGRKEEEEGGVCAYPASCLPSHPPQPTDQPTAESTQQSQDLSIPLPSLPSHTHSQAHLSSREPESLAVVERWWKIGMMPPSLPLSLPLQPPSLSASLCAVRERTGKLLQP